MPIIYIQSDWRHMLHITCYFICYAYLSIITLNYYLIFTSYIIHRYTFYIHLYEKYNNSNNIHFTKKKLRIYYNN